MRNRYALKRQKREARQKGVVPLSGGEKAQNPSLRERSPAQGVVKHFSRSEPAANGVTSMCMVKHLYQDAIEYTAMAKGMRGMILLLSLSMSLGIFWFVWFDIHHLWEGPNPLSFDFGSMVYAPIFTLVGIYWAVKGIRLELFRPEDEPTIFDRKNRKVYRIYRETYAGWKGLLVPWPMKAVEHDWDLIEAEHHAAVMTTGSTVTRLHGLIFLVRKSLGDPTVVDSFAIGNGMQMGEITVPLAWEHIRRFMEEGGPHLPPNETLQPYRQPATFWQCMAAPFPSFATVRACWFTELPTTLMCVFFSPIVLPTMVALGFFTWLAYLTSTSIAWSPAVLEAVGARIDPADASEKRYKNYSGERT